MYEMLILRKCVLLFHFNNVPKKRLGQGHFYRSVVSPLL